MADQQHVAFESLWKCESYRKMLFMDETQPEWLTEGRTTLITEDGTGQSHASAQRGSSCRPHSRTQVRKFWVSEGLTVTVVLLNHLKSSTVLPLSKSQTCRTLFARVFLASSEWVQLCAARMISACSSSERLVPAGFFVILYSKMICTLNQHLPFHHFVLFSSSSSFPSSSSVVEQ